MSNPNTPKLTEAAAFDMMISAYPWATPAELEADAKALAAIAADPMLSAALFGLAKLSKDVNTLEMRSFMIHYARANDLSAGKWRSMADVLPVSLCRFA